MGDAIRALDLRGPGWKMRIDLEEFFIQPGAQLSRLLKMLEKAESHNALEPIGCGDVLTSTPRILAAMMLLEVELPERLHESELRIRKLTEDIDAERRAHGESGRWERLTDEQYLARQRKRRLQAAQKRLTAHKELILKWIQVQK